MLIAAISSVLITLLILAAAIYHYRLEPAGQIPTRYARRRPLNSHEQVLYWRLAGILPEHVVLAQVSMLRCIGARGPNARVLAFEKIDFIVCTKAMHIMAAIEITDENSLLNEYRQKVQQIKEDALDAANIRLIKCTAQALLSEDYIAMEFNQHTSLITCLGEPLQG
jgi:hypothetical protein